MKKAITLLFLLIGTSAYADILMQWDRKPLSVDLQINQERMVIADKNVKVGYPANLESKLRVQSTGGVVFFKALDTFPATRIQLRDFATGELILLDVSAHGKIPNADEPIRLVYTDKVMVQSTVAGQQDDGMESAYSNYTPPQLPVQLALTRYAAQSLYAPLRTVEPLVGVRQVAHRLPKKITTLLPDYPVEVTPLISWQLEDYVVTAVRLQNRGKGRIDLDPRKLQGRFYAATFQHTWLSAYGVPEDTTTLYLVTKGFADKAVIPETKKYTPARKKIVRKVTTQKIAVQAETGPLLQPTKIPGGEYESQ